MTKDEHIKYWIDSAKDDLESARINFANKRFNWCLFIAHLSLEKVLKANFINHYDNINTPKSHNLLKLAELSEIELSDEQAKFLLSVNNFQISTRYPDYKQDFYKIASEEYTLNYLNQIEEFFKWLKSLLK